MNNSQHNWNPLANVPDSLAQIVPVFAAVILEAIFCGRFDRAGGRNGISWRLEEDHGVGDKSDALASWLENRRAEYLRRIGHTGPRYEHDCDCCRFVGQYDEDGKEYDLWFCNGAPSGEGGSLIARCGSEGPDYCSVSVRIFKGCDQSARHNRKYLYCAALAGVL